MKRAAIYLRNDKIFVRTSSHETSGAWLENGPCTTLPNSVAPEALGDVVCRHLAASETGVSFPDWRALQQPLLSAAGVKNWNVFGKTARAVAVEQLDDGTLTVEATKNEKRDFGAIEGGLVRLSAGADSRSVGDAVKAALARSR